MMQALRGAPDGAHPHLEAFCAHITCSPHNRALGVASSFSRTARRVRTGTMHGAHTPPVHILSDCPVCCQLPTHVLFFSLRLVSTARRSLCTCMQVPAPLSGRVLSMPGSRPPRMHAGTAAKHPAQAPLLTPEQHPVAQRQVPHPEPHNVRSRHADARATQVEVAEVAQVPEHLRERRSAGAPDRRAAQAQPP